MLEIVIPGAETFHLEHLVADYNGTLACDGRLLPESVDAIRRLSGTMNIHVITADTFGQARKELASLPCEIAILPPGNQSRAKLAYIEKLGSSHCACIGNGRNDRRMLAAAALGIAVVQREGAAMETLSAAKVVCPDIRAALELLLNPKRLIATLRD